MTSQMVNDVAYIQTVRELQAWASSGADNADSPDELDRIAQMFVSCLLEIETGKRPQMPFLPDNPPDKNNCGSMFGMYMEEVDMEGIMKGLVEGLSYPLPGRVSISKYKVELVKILPAGRGRKFAQAVIKRGGL